MRTLVAALLSAAFVTSLAAAADAKPRKKYRGEPRSYSYSPSTVAERQRNRRTFDENEYYERDSNRIPFGTAAWWRQKMFESGNVGN